MSITLFSPQTNRLELNDIVQVSKGSNGINIISKDGSPFAQTFQDKHLKEGTELSVKITYAEGRKVATLEAIT